MDDTQPLQQQDEHPHESSHNIFALLLESICFLSKGEDDHEVYQHIADLLQDQARMYEESDDLNSVRAVSK